MCVCGHGVTLPSAISAGAGGPPAAGGAPAEDHIGILLGSTPTLAIKGHSDGLLKMGIWSSMPPGKVRMSRALSLWTQRNGQRSGR